tara:strand:+ start:657 stop:956 length:300 start_codon:yes stop_codon:yes gene_type:complete
MDKRINNGGARKGAGRKPKAQEQDLIESLDNIIDLKQAIEVLKELVYGGDLRAMQLFLNYRFGKPKETVDITQFVEQPLFLDVSEDYSNTEDTEAQQAD